jgi:hypothetical protein
VPPFSPRVAIAGPGWDGTAFAAAPFARRGPCPRLPCSPPPARRRPWCSAAHSGGERLSGRVEPPSTGFRWRKTGRRARIEGAPDLNNRRSHATAPALPR